MNERLLNPVVKRSAAVRKLCTLVERIAISHLEIDGLENLTLVREILNEGGKVVVFPNHLSHADAPILNKSMRESDFKDLAEKLRFITGSMLMKNRIEWIMTHGFDGILMPADRDPDISESLRVQMVKNGLAEVNETVTSGKLLTVFAEGGRSKGGKMRQVRPNVALYTRLTSPEDTYGLTVGFSRR